jgi:hypothetical protein
MIVIFDDAQTSMPLGGIPRAQCAFEDFVIRWTLHGFAGNWSSRVHFQGPLPTHPTQQKLKCSTSHTTVSRREVIQRTGWKGEMLWRSESQCVDDDPGAETRHTPTSGLHCRHTRAPTETALPSLAACSLSLSSLSSSGLFCAPRDGHAQSQASNERLFFQRAKPSSSSKMPPNKRRLAATLTPPAAN